MKTYSFVYFILIIIFGNFLLAKEIKQSHFDKPSFKSTNELSTRIKDPSPKRVNGKLKNGSHVKLFLPYLPYLAKTNSIKEMLTKPANNEKGWE